MAIEVFGNEEFEEALPNHRETGEPVWVSLGLMGGEYVYTVPIVENEVYILIRSSVRGDGLSAEVGRDSIRAWLVDKDWQPLGTKVNHWITREAGWQTRLVEMLRNLWERARKAGFCPKCNKARGVFKVRRNNENKGKLFVNCLSRCTGSFGWL